ncbi:MAG: hypothetical protein WCX71_02800 [Candidatus Buchananbacteria bacterium]|jgi:hypothetical protein
MKNNHKYIKYYTGHEKIIFFSKISQTNPKTEKSVSGAKKEEVISFLW